MSEEEINNEESVNEYGEAENDEEETKQYSLEELIEMAKSGWHLWYDKKYNRIRLRDPETRRTISIPYDEELYKRLKSAKEKSKKNAEQEEKQEATGFKKKVQVVEDIALWNTFIGKHRPLIESLISRISWLQDAVLDIGMNALIFSMLVSRENPEDIKEVINKIHDRNEFVAYVMDKLHSLYVASKGLDTIEELKLKIRQLEAENAVLYQLIQSKNEEINKYKNMVNNLKRKLDIALSIMNRKELKQYLRVLILTSYENISPEKLIMEKLESIIKTAPPASGEEKASGEASPEVGERVISQEENK